MTLFLYSYDSNDKNVVSKHLVDICSPHLASKTLHVIYTEYMNLSLGIFAGPTCISRVYTSEQFNQALQAVKSGDTVWIQKSNELDFGPDEFITTFGAFWNKVGAWAYSFQGPVHVITQDQALPGDTGRHITPQSMMYNANVAFQYRLLHDSWTVVKSPNLKEGVAANLFAAYRGEVLSPIPKKKLFTYACNSAEPAMDRLYAVIEATKTEREQGARLHIFGLYPFIGSTSLAPNTFVYHNASVKGVAITENDIVFVYINKQDFDLYRGKVWNDQHTTHVTGVPVGSDRSDVHFRYADNRWTVRHHRMVDTESSIHWVRETLEKAAAGNI